MTDAATDAEDAQFDMRAAPLSIGRVRLRVRDLASMHDFYQTLLGLETLDRGAGWSVLGAPGAKGPQALLELAGDPGLAPLDRRQAGLFHTAFLMPGRADLGRWLGHAAATTRLEGASDHIVSEALYLSDPEGNGIEVYADRPEAAWRTPSGTVEMATRPLDIPALLAAGDGGSYVSAPAGLIVGHVHLQVGDTRAADGFYRDALGFDVAADYSGARFYGSGGYHHQLAGNVWNSRGAGPRPADAAGLDAVEIAPRDAAVRDVLLARAEAAGLPLEHRDGRPGLRDPWGSLFDLAA